MQSWDKNLIQRRRASSSKSPQLAHTLLRLVFAVRYRKNLVIAIMAASAFLGGLYYATRPRLYSSKASLLVSQNGHDQLDTSIANDESLRQNTMPTFEKIIISAKVLEGRCNISAPPIASISTTVPVNPGWGYCRKM